MFRACAYFNCGGLEFTVVTLGREDLTDTEMAFNELTKMPGFTGGHLEECIEMFAGKRMWAVYQN